ncbi:MAG: sigma-70 family RNA polymerase sigma factor [Pirellulales bacterium]
MTSSFEPVDAPIEPERGGTPADPFAADIAAARAGCEQALNRLFTACRPYLLLVANQGLPAKLRAKMGGSDLVQETLLQVKRNFARFRGDTEAELIAWLRGALLNNLQAETRRYRTTQKRELSREVSLDGGFSDAEHEGPVDVAVPSPGSQMVAAEEATRLNAALARLPDDYRLVIELRNWDERPFNEIGEILGRSADAARKLWARAIEQLKSELRRQ